MAYDAGEVDLHARIKVRMDGSIEGDDGGPGSPLGDHSRRDSLRRHQQGDEQEGAGQSHRQLLPNLRRQDDRHPGRPAKGHGLQVCHHLRDLIAIDDMVIPANKKDIVAKADKESSRVQKQYMDGLITDGERYNKVIDIWAQATEKIAAEMLSGIGNGGDRHGRRQEANRRELQPHLHDGRFRGQGKRRADPAAGRHAGPDGQAFRRNHRDPDHGQFP